MMTEERKGMSFERMTRANDGEPSTCISSPPPLAKAVVRATTALDRAVGFEPAWIGYT